jgi:hypothetical protein
MTMVQCALCSDRSCPRLLAQCCRCHERRLGYGSSDHITFDSAMLFHSPDALSDHSGAMRPWFSTLTHGLGSSNRLGSTTYLLEDSFIFKITRVFLLRIAIKLRRIFGRLDALLSCALCDPRRFGQFIRHETADWGAIEDAVRMSRHNKQANREKACDLADLLTRSGGCQQVRARDVVMRICARTWNDPYANPKPISAAEVPANETDALPTARSNGRVCTSR